MTRDETPTGVRSRTIETDRLTTHVLESGDPEGEGTLVLLHGNVSSSRFFEPVLSDFPERYYAIAPDFRGYGDSATKPVDATAGVRAFVADLRGLLSTLEAESVVIVGWSLGGGVAMQYTIEYPGSVEALVLVNPVSPYGFGGTRDLEGTPCFEDYAGSGGGIANGEFVDALSTRDRSEGSEASPRKILRTFYVAPAHNFEAAREKVYLTGMLDTATGPDNYPGSAIGSDNWPGFAPGETGVNNAISPKYCDLSPIIYVDAQDKPDVLWIRGAADQIVSNESLFDLGTLGRMGQLPEWPGESVFPPQPMVDQTRVVLERYADRGGSFEEVVFGNAGHTPHVEVPGDFRVRLEATLESR